MAFETSTWKKVAASVAALALGVSLQTAAETPDKGVHRHERQIPVGDGHSLHVTELFTADAERRSPRRAVLLLPGAEFRGNFWSIPVEGYDAASMAARRGFYAFTVDYLGVGESSRPADGSALGQGVHVDSIRRVVDAIRSSRGVGRVDLVGGGLGARIAMRLAAEPERVRSVTLGPVVYLELAPELRSFFTPELEARLRGAPDGYWEPDFLDRTLAHSPNSRREI